MTYCTNILMKALRQGNKLHAFRSGGGLRVVRLEDKENQLLNGYGEHPHFEEAIQYAEENWSAGGQKYEEVYGVKYPHYLTGSASRSSELDGWLLQGHTIDAYFKNDEFVVELNGLKHVDIPKEVVDKTYTHGPQKWADDQGYEYQTSLTKIPNGELAVKTMCIKGDNKTAWMRRIKKISRSKDLNEAFLAVINEKDIVIENL